MSGEAERGVDAVRAIVTAPDIAVPKSRAIATLISDEAT